MTTATESSLLDFANSCDHPVLFWSGVGCPAGKCERLNDTDWSLTFSVSMDDTERLESLNGTVTDGRWEWDGEGDMRDFRGNSITRMSAYSDSARWESLAEEYTD